MFFLFTLNEMKLREKKTNFEANFRFFGGKNIFSTRNCEMNWPKCYLEHYGQKSKTKTEWSELSLWNGNKNSNWQSLKNEN